MDSLWRDLVKCDAGSVVVVLIVDVERGVQGGRGRMFGAGV